MKQNTADIKKKVRDVMKDSSLTHEQRKHLEESLMHNNELMKQLAEL